MPRVLCTLRHCSTNVSGTAFQAVPGGMLSEDLTPAQAEQFLRIPGYVAYAGDVPKPDASMVISAPPSPSTASAGDEPEPSSGSQAESDTSKKKGKGGKA